MEKRFSEDKKDQRNLQELQEQTTNIKESLKENILNRAEGESQPKIRKKKKKECFWGITSLGQ